MANTSFAGALAPPCSMTILQDQKTRTDLLHRLKRAEGQLRGIQRMIEAGEPCQPVAVQMSAVRKALDSTYVRMTVCFIEQELGERLGQLGLSDTGRTGENERTGWAVRVFETGTLAANRLGNRANRFVLTDDALVQLVFHVDELGALFFADLENRDAGRLRQNLGDKTLVDDSLSGHVAIAERLFELDPLDVELLLFIALRGSKFEVLVFDGLLFVDANGDDALLECTQFGRRRQNRQAQTGTGFVDQVDCLVWQEAVGHIAV